MEIYEREFRQQTHKKNSKNEYFSTFEQIQKNFTKTRVQISFEQFIE